MTKAVAKKETQLPTLPAENSGEEFGLSSKDLRTETLLLMQPSSDMVAQDKAKLGNIIRNESEKIIGGFDKPIEVIGLFKFETLRMYAAKGGKFIKETEVPAQIEREGIEMTLNGEVAVRRYQTINFLVLLVDDIKNGEAFPLLIRFRSSSFTAGNKFGSFLYRKNHFGKKPWEFVVSLSVEKRQNEDKQNWAVFTFNEGRSTTAEEKEIGIMMHAEILKKYASYKAYAAYTADSDESGTGGAAAAKPVVVGAAVGSDQGEY